MSRPPECDTECLNMKQSFELNAGYQHVKLLSGLLTGTFNNSVAYLARYDTLYIPHPPDI